MIIIWHFETSAEFIPLPLLDSQQAKLNGLIEVTVHPDVWALLRISSLLLKITITD